MERGKGNPSILFTLYLSVKSSILKSKYQVLLITIDLDHHLLFQFNFSYIHI